MNPLYFEHDGQRIAYDRGGDPHNPPLLLVHGWLADVDVWDPLMPWLRQRFDCVRINLLGHGRSDAPGDGDYSIAAQAARVVALADHLGWERFALMGHSMGGQTSLFVASRLIPQRIVKLVDVAAPVSGALTDASASSAPLLQLTQNAPWLLPIARPLLMWVPLSKIVHRMYFSSPVPDENWVRAGENNTRPSAAAAGYAGMQAIQACDLTADLPNISAPTLILFGRLDHTIPPSEGELAHQHIPDSELVWLEGVGHTLQVEATEEMRAALQRFFDDGTSQA